MYRTNKLEFKTKEETNTIWKKILFLLSICTIIGFFCFYDELYVKYFYTTYYENRKIFKNWLKHNWLSEPEVNSIGGIYYKKWVIDSYTIFYNKTSNTDNWFVNKGYDIVIGTFVSGKYDKKLYNEILEILRNA